eukprot:1853069-Amphidinium_carterae.1
MGQAPRPCALPGPSDPCKQSLIKETKSEEYATRGCFQSIPSTTAHTDEIVFVLVLAISVYSENSNGVPS